MNRHLDKCPICGSPHLKPFLTCKDYYATGEEFQVVACADCGFKMTQDVPVEAEISRYYESPDYISHSDTKTGLMNRIYHWVRSYMLQRKAKLVEQVSCLRTGKVLDIGTGTGYFVHTMHQRGWQVEAIEKSADARKFAQDNFGLTVLDDSQMDSFPDAHFDVITLWHVMEHIEDLDKLWALLKRQLHERGRLVIAVPNCGGVDAQLYQEMWAAYDVPRHLWHFDFNTMLQLAEKQGFELCELHPMPFDAYYVSMLSEKYKGCKYYFLKGLVAGFKCWFNSAGKAENSSSLIYVFCKK